MNYQLVPMDRSHLEGVAALERTCFSHPWSVEMLAEELYNETASFLVAEGEDGSVLGYAGLHVVLDEGYIDNVAVDPACRRQGIADALIDTLSGSARPGWPSSPWRCGRATHPPSPSMRSTASMRWAAGRATTTTRRRTPF